MTGTLIEPFPSRRADDGARVVRADPTSSPGRTLAAIMDAKRLAYRDGPGRGCVQFKPGPHVTDYDIALEPDEQILWRGVPGSTALRSTEYLTHPIFTATSDRVLIRDIAFEGGADLTDVLNGPSVLVLNGGSGHRILNCPLRYGFNDGIVIRGPGCSDIRISCPDSDGFGGIGGHAGHAAHVVAVSGDSSSTPGQTFDVRDIVVKVTGRNLVNGVVNMGQALRWRAFVEVTNDFDEADGPVDSGYAALRVANGSRSGRFYVYAYGAGRAFRIGPCDDVQGKAFAEMCAYEGVLLSSTVWHESGHRGGGTDIEAKVINCCLLGGSDAVHARSHGPARVVISAENRAGFAALPGTIDVTPANDQDDEENVGAKMLHVYWDTFDQYEFVVTDAGGGNCNFVIRRDNGAGTGTTVVNLAGVANNNATIAAAINALAGIFRAYAMNGVGNLSTSTTARKGSMSNRFGIDDAHTTLAAGLAAGTGNTALTVTSAATLLDSPNGQSHLPCDAEIRPADTSTPALAAKRERVRIESRAGNVLTLTRDLDGTGAVAWSAGDTIYAHPSRIVDAGGYSKGLLNDLLVIGPGRDVRTQRGALASDISIVRPSAAVATVGRGVLHVHFTGTTAIETILQRERNADLYVHCVTTGLVLKHGTGNLQLLNGQDYSMRSGDVAHLRCDDNGHNFEEVSVSRPRAPRTVALGNLGAGQTFTLLNAEPDPTVTLNLDQNGTLTLAGLFAGAGLTIEATQASGGNHTLTLAGGTVKTPGGTGLVLSTAAGAVDVITVYSPDGASLRAAAAMKAIA